MRLCGEEMLHEIALVIITCIRITCLHATDSFPATCLHTILARSSALDVATMAESDDHAVIGNEILNRDLSFIRKNRAAARCRVLFFDLKEFIFDNRKHALLTSEDIEKVRNLFKDRVILSLDLIPLHRSELIEAELEDGIYLTIREDIFISLNAWLATNQDPKCLSGLEGKVVSFDLLARFITVLRITDHLDEVIKVAQCEKISLQVLGALFRLLKKVAGSANNDLTAVLNEGIQRIKETQLLGTTLVNREHVNSKRGLHCSELKELVHHNLRTGVALQSNLDASIVSRKVTHTRDIEQDFFANEFGNSDLQSRTVHPMRNLANHDLGRTSFTLGHFHDTAHFDAATSGTEVAIDSLKAANLTRRGKVRPLDVLLHCINRDIRIIDTSTNTINHFSHVVGRDVGGHTDRNTGASIDKEVWNRGR